MVGTTNEVDGQCCGRSMKRCLLSGRGPYRKAYILLTLREDAPEHDEELDDVEQAFSQGKPVRTVSTDQIIIADGGPVHIF